MSTSFENKYEDSNNFIKNNLSTIIKIAVTLGLIIALFFGLRYYFKDDKEGTAAVTPANYARSYNAKIGPENAKIKVVYSQDYGCSFCQSNHPTILEIENKYKDRVQFYLKNSANLKVYSASGAEAVQAANIQSGELAFKLNDAIFNTITSKGSISITEIEDLAKEIEGLDFEKWNKDKNSSEIEKQVEQDTQDLATLNVKIENRKYGTSDTMTATPGVVIIKDDKILAWWTGAISIEDFTKTLDEILKENDIETTSISSTQLSQDSESK